MKCVLLERLGMKQIAIDRGLKDQDLGVLRLSFMKDAFFWPGLDCIVVLSFLYINMGGS